MSDFQYILPALAQVFTVTNLALIFGGLILGMIVGCIPGLSVTLGIILLLPLTYTFSSPDSAIIALLAVYVGGMYGGSISAITLNTPGTNSAIATTFDGYPLAKKGKVKKALDTSLFASTFGGLFSAILLLLCASFITHLVSKFASVEYFSMAILGISLIAGVSGDSLAKGILSGLLGILMAAIGTDAVTGVWRYTFGIDALRYGIDMLPAMIALIALTQVVQKLRDFVLANGKLDDASKIDREGLTGREMISILPACTRSSVVASILGAMPGVGGGVAQFMCYNECRRASKHPEMFGKGAIEGIAASESANNAVTGGALIPMLTLGIPGSGTCAIMLGGMMIQGLTPGYELFTKQGEITYAVILGFLIANVLMGVLGMLVAKYVVRICVIPNAILIPLIIGLATIGAFAIQNSNFDVTIMLLFGLIGYFARKLGFATAPMILGMILGPMAEKNWNQVLLICRGDLVGYFFSRPISIVLFVMVVIGLFTPVIMRFFSKKTIGDPDVVSKED